MNNLKISCSTIVISDELKAELEKLPFDETQQIIADNVEIIRTSDNIEMLTLLLDVVDCKIVSKKDATEEEKIQIADKQYTILKENMHKKDFKKNMKKQMQVAMNIQKEIVRESGNTPIKWFGGTIRVLPLPVNEFLAICYSIFNMLLSYYSMNTYDPSIGVTRFSLILSLLANMMNIFLLCNCIILLLFGKYKQISDEKDN